MDAIIEIEENAKAAWTTQQTVTGNTIESEAVRDGLELVRPETELISARMLTEHEGRKFFSYVFHGAGSDRIVKQATGELAIRDAKFLEQLSGPFFPRVYAAEPPEGWSRAEIEFVAGKGLREAAPEIGKTPKRLAEFFQDCLDLLGQLQKVGITHRDIRPDNMLVRNGQPVLIDFGWAVSAEQPSWTPNGLGQDGRPEDGIFCDVFAMGKLFEKLIPPGTNHFAPLIAVMTVEDRAARVSGIPALKSLLQNLMPTQSFTVPSSKGVVEVPSLFGRDAKAVPAPAIVPAPVVMHRSKAASQTNVSNEVSACHPVQPPVAQQYGNNGIIQEIGTGDEMFSGDRPHYFAVGESALHGIQSALNTAQKPARKIRRILDLPCGHGRVMRYLKGAFADAQITACDLNRGAVDFCARTFGAEPVYSNVDVNQIAVQGKFDLIWCGSLLTHLRPQPCADLVKWFHSRMNPGSMLFFTMHGRWVERSLATRRYTYGLTEQAVTTILEEYYRDGFGYADYPGQAGYGISVSSPAFVLSKLVGLPDLKLVAYTEKGWDNHQDIICVQRQSPGELLG